MSKQNNKLLGNKVIVGDLPLNVALRKFKQKVEDSGVLETVRSKMFYEKPTTERKRRKGAAKSRWQKKLRDNELPKKNY
jgi:small subunit ribosomal protein S21